MKFRKQAQTNVSVRKQMEGVETEEMRLIARHTRTSDVAEHWLVKFIDVVFLPLACVVAAGRLNGDDDTFHVVIIIPVSTVSKVSKVK